MWACALCSATGDCTSKGNARLAAGQLRLGALAQRRDLIVQCMGEYLPM